MTVWIAVLLALLPRQLDPRLSAGEWDGVLSQLRAELSETVAAGDAAAEGWARVQIAHALLERNFYHEKNEKSADDASREALAAAEKLNPAALARALFVRGRFLYGRAFEGKDWLAPENCFRRALVLFEEEGDRRAQSEAWFYLGLIEQMQDRQDKAVALFGKGLRLAGSGQDPLLESYFHRHLGFAAQEQGRPAQAERSYRESLALREKAGAAVFIPFARIALADFLAQSGGDHAEIRGLYEAAAATAEGCGSWRAAFQARLALARLLAGLKEKREQALKAAAAAGEYGDPASVREAEELLRTLPDPGGGGTE